MKSVCQNGSGELMGKEIFVHIDLAGTTVLVGRLWVHARRGRESSSFAYEKNWLLRDDSFSLEPALLLGESSFYTDKSLFGAMGDSAPDRWGRILMKRQEIMRAKNARTTPKTLLESDFLLQVCDFSRQGALRFSLPPDQEFLDPGTSSVIPPLIKLGKLLGASDRVSRDESLQEDIDLLTAPGSSLGGARPKASVLDNDNSLIIAKFPCVQDEWNVPLWEYVALRLARKAGIRTPEFRLENVAGKQVLLVSRFDRMKNRRIPYLSAMSMLNAYDGEHGSYLFIAEAIKEHGAAPATDCRELWQRIVFNILVANVDDHLRNHGFLYAGRNGWRLSPVFDLEPTPLSAKQRILHTCIDATDNSASIDLALSVCDEFFLTLAEAKKLVSKTQLAVDTWRQEAIRAGADKKEMASMASAYQ